MKVLNILNELKPSGAETMLRAAASAWHTRGMRIDVLSTGATEGIYASALREIGYEVYHIPFKRSYGFFRAVYKLLRRRKYDVVHIHAERGSLWYALLADLAGVRCTIRTAHNVFQVNARRRIGSSIRRWVMRELLGVKMVSISASVEKNERERFRNPSLLIPNWFDSKRFGPTEDHRRQSVRLAMGISEDTFALVSVGNCSPIKNHLAVVEAIAELKKYPIVWFHIGMEASDHPERALAERLGLSERIRFCGILDDITPMLCASDIYVMPSLYEGCPIAAIEAMGAGLPAVLSDVPGLCDFRDAGDGIRWVKPTADSIREGILHFQKLSRSARRDLGLQLSSYAHERFSIDRGAGLYFNLYERSRGRSYKNGLEVTSLFNRKK